MKYYFIGTDEAGYGPNLGPLSVSASLWSAEFSRSDTPLSLLNARVLDCMESPGGFRICDSKKLYHPGRLTQLERSFFYAYRQVVEPQNDLPLLRQIDHCLSYEQWTDVVRTISVLPAVELKFCPPWEEESSFLLPLTKCEIWSESFVEDCQRVNARLAKEGIYLERIAARRVQPEEFNLLIDQLGLKSELLAAVTLETAKFLLMPILEKTLTGEEEIILCCDKLGGRNQYADLLTRFFPGLEFRVEIESRALSYYRFFLPHGKMSILFQVKGESNIPSALASIVSKYQREISMEAFNRYWCRRLPELEPTAGYPLDAKRFRNETDAVRKAEGITDEIFWRKK